MIDLVLLLNLFIYLFDAYNVGVQKTSRASLLKARGGRGTHWLLTSLLLPLTLLTAGCAKE